MFTRQEILDTLNQQQERMTKRYLTFTSEELDRPCTASETPNASPWTPKDHLAHMTMIEQMFLDIVRRALAGNPDPIGLHRFGSMDSEGLTNWLYQKGPTVSAEQNNHGLKAFQDWLHRVNQDYVDAHHSDNLDTLITNFNAVRSTTVALINDHSDEELTTPIPDSPWADGTVGELLLTNANHDILHMSWLKKGLQAEQAQS